MSVPRPRRRGQVLAWALYDWANSAFATTVIAGFFPIFFKTYWSAAQEPTQSTFHLGLANSIASAVIVLLAPVLGAIADRGGARKQFLFCFAALGVLMTFALSLVAKGQWQLAAAVYVLAGVGFAGANVFYDALLLEVAETDSLDRVSAYGYGLGYLGGGLLFALNVLMTLYPQSFGLADAAQAVRVSFVTVAIWWAVFSLPLLGLRAAPSSPPAPGRAAIREGLAALRKTFEQVRGLRPVLLFLLAYWFYIDGVHTIIRMAVDYGLSLGFPSTSLIVALLITQFVGFPAALGFGWLAQRTGPKPGIYLGIAVYGAVTAWSYFMQAVWEFYVLAVAVGLVQGGVQALSRSFYARLIPAADAAQFFGFFNLLGKFAAILGPLLMGAVGLATGSSRVAIASVAVLFLIGALLLRAVETPPEPAPRV